MAGAAHALLLVDSTANLQYQRAMRSCWLRSDHLGSLASEGTRQLWEAKRRKGWSQNQLARELKVDSGTINRILHGKQEPSLHLANEISRRLGIATSCWSQSPKRPLVLKTGIDG